MVTQEAAQLRGGLGQLGPFGGRHQQLGTGQLGHPADVVLVQVRQDSGVDIGRGVYPSVASYGEGVLLADVEAGEPAIQVAGETAGEVGGYR